MSLLLRHSRSLKTLSTKGFQQNALLTKTQPPAATLHEVTGRDGLQNEKTIFSLDQKLQLARLLSSSGAMSVEVASFVRPDLVPAMADSLDLCLELADQPWAHAAHARGVGFAGLVPNLKGFETFLKARAGASRGISQGPSISSNHEEGVLDTVVCLVSCTESHSMANVRRPIADALAMTCDVVQAAKENNIKVYAYTTLAFECPFEGSVDPDQVAAIIAKYAKAGADRIVLADTLGKAQPHQVDLLLERVKALDVVVPMERLALHLHDAHGKAAQNVQRGLDLGITSFDAATGGCGGCNFVPDAKGNISTESVLTVLEANGYQHGVAWNNIHEARALLESVLGRSLSADEL